MAYQPKSYRKFIATAATATIVASAVAPAASAASVSDFKDVAAKYQDAVNYLVVNGITQGTSDTTFGTHENVKRGDAAIWLAKALKLDLTNVPASGFSDTGRYDAAVSALKAKGILSGKTETTYAPNALLTRGEMAKILANAYQLESDAAVPFTDLGPNFGPYIKALYEYEVTQGKTETTFGTSQNITRGDLAIFLKRAAEVVKTPEVKNVTVLNGKQLEVNFTTAVDEDTVVNEDALHSNVTITGVDGAAQNPGSYTAELSEDGKTLTITASNFFKGGYTVAVSDAVKTTTGVKLPKYASVVTVNDVTAPKFVSANSVAKEVTKEVNVVFDEPVQSTGVIAYINGEAATVKNGSLNTLTVTSSTDIKAGTSVEVSLLNVKDAAGNLISPNPFKTTVTVTADTATPSVSSVAVVGENKVNVTFNKKVKNDAALKNALSLLDPNGVKVGDFTFVKVQNDGKTVEYTAPKFTFGPNNTYTGTLLVQDTVLDTLGNKMASKYSSSVTFSKDTVAPVAQKAEYKNGKLQVTFSEEVSEVSAGNKAGLKVINKATGAEVSLGEANVKVDSSDKKVYVIDQTIANGSYELRLPAGLVKDDSITSNKNAAVILEFTASASATADKDAPKFTYATDTTNLDIEFETVADGTAPAAEQVFTYSVQDDSGIDVSTVRDLNNYTLNGKALPAGTYITSNYNPNNVKSALEVKVYVPSNKIGKTNKDSVLVVSGIKDAAGNAANPQVSEKVAVYDGVAPELTSAVISSGDKSVLVLDFSEEVVGFDKAADLVLKVNGTTATVASVTKQTTGTDKGKYYVTSSSTSDFTAASTVTVELAKEDGGQVTDSQGNPAVFGESVKVK